MLGEIQDAVFSQEKISLLDSIVCSTMYNLHCTFYSVQCTMYSVQCAVYSVQCTVYSVQCTVFNSLQCLYVGSLRNH